MGQGISVPDWLSIGGSTAGHMFRVTEFNMAGSDDSAKCQHVQRDFFLVLARSAQLQILNW